MRTITTHASLIVWIAPALATLGCGSIPDADDECLARNDSALSAAPPPFVLGDQSCPKAHCDGEMSDLLNAPVPGSGAKVMCRKPGIGPGLRTGSGFGLGCSSNGNVAACTFWGAAYPWENRLQVFNNRGGLEWGSSELGYFAGSSAPLVAENGHVIAADVLKIIRFDERGDEVWRTDPDEGPGGVPISPVLTDEGILIVATTGGPMSAYDVDTGDRLAVERLGGFDTRNTPALATVDGKSRIYVSTDKDGVGRLYAVDVHPDAERLFEIKWYYDDYLPPSEASPTVIGDRVFFDGYRKNRFGIDKPYLFGVRDTGPSYDAAGSWAQETVVQTFSSATRDPRGGLWTWELNRRWLYRRSEQTGEIEDQIDVNGLFRWWEGYQAPNSPLTIGGPPGRPVMVLNTGSLAAPHYIIAIDLVSKTKVWSHKIANLPSVNTTAAQFPVLFAEDGSPTVVAGTWSAGPMFIGTSGSCER